MFGVVLSFFTLQYSIHFRVKMVELHTKVIIHHGFSGKVTILNDISWKKQFSPDAHFFPFLAWCPGFVPTLTNCAIWSSPLLLFGLCDLLTPRCCLLQEHGLNSHGRDSQLQLHTPGIRYRLTTDLVTLYTPFKTPQNTPVQTVLI